ncbi:beta-ketoacyl synthase N-terminal-like domain-containing protein [Actinophytocola sp.]|jgi:amino acid adenylation domain-containing protein|uniref:beta-ketoacyl synthase N-terminal-like domain-containing protein n=1 Tax=Actinophytocola sp. TaxID=1872138 RepID=UPI002ED8093F
MTPLSTIRRFADVAERFPDRQAVVDVTVDGGAGLTYAALAALAGGRTRGIAAAGVAPARRVGLVTEHGAETIAGILGVLGAGCAYVPLDPTFPVERLSYQVAAADVSLVLANRAHADLAHRLSDTVLIADDLAPARLEPADTDLDDVAYVLFTSGSTGRPKAVAQTHRNLMHVVDNQISSLSITAADRLSLLASFGFDAAIPDLYPALLTGAALVPIDLRTHGVAHAAAALARQAVTIYHSTPTVYRYLLDALGDMGGAGRLDTVRTVLLGGEQSTYADVARGREVFAPGCVFVNGYGATEVTFAAQYQVAVSEVDPAATGPLPIGTALPGYELVLLGESKEIAVRGRHLVGGYANVESDAFATGADGVRQYRTGDLGQALPDGGLVCLGRLDRQVNVRGFRVELTEVEAALRARPGVSAARVVVRGEDLLGYVVAGRGADADLDGRALRGAVAETLPGYAVPRAVVVLDEFPLTVTGKLDELALPDPPREATTGHRLSPAEQRVHDIWCAVLRTDHVAPTDNFFDIGGHSLLLGQVQQRLAAGFGTDVALMKLFEHPTIAAQARFLTGGETGKTGGERHPRPVPGTSPRQPATHAEYTGDEIAVVGMAGRFPGAADLDSFWWNLCAGVDGIHDYSDSELAALGIGPGLRGDPRHVRSGGKLDGIADFDAGFFSFGADEAARTDPQHRLFLETAWEAMENAGHDPADEGTSVGVFAATSANRYFLFHLFGNPAVSDADPDDWEAQLLGRQFTDHLPGQVAYRLGLTGPALAVQTACSSSLAAVALAAQSLADYRCDLALAGGVSVTWPRHRHVPGGMASADGRCRAFDEAASGTGFSSGVGVVALRRLADALEDGDHVYAVLPGWGMTNDGADRAGFAVPGPGGQAAAVAEALAVAEIAPAEVRFVEAHGSGTPLGDAIEVAALNEVFEGSAPPESCALGSVKTNIGHLDAAAGIAGLIKAVLAVRDGIIPPNLHFSRPHPELDLESGPFYVPTKVRDWPDADRRVAGVSSFGLGGTNVHVLVAEPPAAEPAEEDGGEYLLPVSARDEHALRAATSRLRDHLAAHRPPLADVAHTLSVGRRPFACRAAVVASTVDDAVRALDSLVPGEVAGAGTLRAIAQRWVDGAPVDLPTDPAGGRRIPLPTYPFQRTRFWIEAHNRGGPR